MAAVPSSRTRTAVAVALPWATWAVLRATGSERGFPLVPAMSFTPYAAATAVLPLGVALPLRSRAGALLSLGAGAVLAGAVLARRGQARHREPPGTNRLRIASVSLRLGLVSAGPVVELVRAEDVDVLVVQELTPDAERRLRAAGIDALLPYSLVRHVPAGEPPANGGAVWSRRPVREAEHVPGGFEQPTARLSGAAGAPDVDVTAVHLWPPTTPASERQWRADLAALPAPERGVLRVLAGDFNASLDHAGLRRVLRLGYDDAARIAGRGLTWTWAPLRFRFPRLVIDHVLVDPRIGVSEIGVFPVPGSDHRAVVAELRLPES
jgi:endonuclease/exonuclease/phosphatase (EEP) superfamily protein YafD